MNIGILDDHELIRVGVTGVLHDTPHIVTISAACAEDLFEALEEGEPCDLLLLDVLMPGTNGFEVAKRMRTEYPEIKIIILSVDTKEYVIMRLMQIGIDGFISKNGPLEEVKLAIDSVAEGVPFYGRDLAVLVRDIVDAQLNKKSSASLTKRELEIIEACCSGLLGKEIADKLHISIHTVNTHRKNITHKTGIKSVAGLAVYAMLHNLIN